MTRSGQRKAPFEGSWRKAPEGCLQALSNLYHVDGANRQPSVSFADSSLRREPYRRPYGLERTGCDIDGAHSGRRNASPTTGDDVRSCRRGRVSRPTVRTFNHAPHVLSLHKSGTACVPSPMRPKETAHMPILRPLYGSGTKGERRTGRSLRCGMMCVRARPESRSLRLCFVYNARYLNKCELFWTKGCFPDILLTGVV